MYQFATLQTLCLPGQSTSFVPRVVSQVPTDRCSWECKVTVGNTYPFRCGHWFFTCHLGLLTAQWNAERLCTMAPTSFRYLAFDYYHTEECTRNMICTMVVLCLLVLKYVTLVNLNITNRNNLFLSR